VHLAMLGQALEIGYLGIARRKLSALNGAFEVAPPQALARQQGR
jgi:hypothetical protein